MSINLYNLKPMVAWDSASNNKIGFSARKDSFSQGRIFVGEFNNVVVNILGLKHLPTMEHDLGTALYAEALAKKIGLDEEQQEVVKTAALLHDVGKILCSDKSFVSRAASLKDAKAYRKHAPIGEALFGKVDLFKKYEIDKIIAQHHEHYDGSGYPNGLKGEEIKLEARILKLADTFDSRTKLKYPYRKIETPQEAIEKMTTKGSRKYDPALLNSFKHIVEDNNYQLFYEVQDKVKIQSDRFRSDFNIPKFSFKGQSFLKDDKVYRAELAKGVGYEPEDLNAVMGANELKQLLENAKPENFDPKSPEYSINLHVHTKASDGEFVPETLFNAVDKRVKQMKTGKFVVAVTDHDKLDGLRNTLKYIAKETRRNPDRFKNVRFVPGIEFNVKYENPDFLKAPLQMEVLGYCINPYEKNLRTMVEGNNQKNKKLMTDILNVAKKKHGIDTTDFKDLVAKRSLLQVPSSGMIQGVLHGYLRKKGLSKEQRRDLMRGKFPGIFLSKYTPSLDEVLKNTKGGMLSIAHPARIHVGKVMKGTKGNPGEEITALGNVFADFKKRGGYGAEAHYQSYSETGHLMQFLPEKSLKKKAAVVHDLTEKAGLLKTGGIDNHELNIFKRK